MFKLSPIPFALLLFSVLVAPVAADGGSRTRAQIGLSAPSGISDLERKLEANNPMIDFRSILPVGASLALHREQASGFGFGAMLGPVIIATGDASFTIVPLTLEVRYSFAGSESSAPYVRLGAERIFTSGELLTQGKAGAVVGAGLQFSARGSRGWGLDVAFHSAEIGVARRGNRPEQMSRTYETVVTVFYAF